MKIYHFKKNNAMTEQQFNEKQAAMPDAELAEKCEKLILDFDENGEKNWIINAPPNVNDYDMLLRELIRRFRTKNDLLMRGGYSETEINRKGCYGPCGRCEEANQQPVTAP